MRSPFKARLARRLGRWQERFCPGGRPVSDADAPLGWPPGHFYSPIPSLGEVRARQAQIFNRQLRELPGIELNPAGQLALLRELAAYFAEFPFAAEPKPGLRFHCDNPNFAWGEALILTSWLRRFPPKTLVEIGCGYSSCAILDVADRYLEEGPACVFLDPMPDLLLRLLTAEDRKRVEIVTCRVQDLDQSWFGRLGAGDLLFIDSSHVAKVGSDVNHLIFEVLPALARGVFVHFHDIYYPFEYPREWVEQGRAWNEAYLLRAFLEYNSAFRIRFWNSYVARFEEAREIAGPIFLKHPGSSLWLEKTASGGEVKECG